MFANILGGGPYTPPTITPIPGATSPNRVPTTSSPAAPPPPIDEAEVMRHILVKILLEPTPAQFASAFELAGITMPYHVTLLSADDLTTLINHNGELLEEPIPLGPINKKLYSGMLKVHDLRLSTLDTLMLPNEEWLRITSDDVIAENLKCRRVHQPWETTAQYNAVMAAQDEDAKIPVSPMRIPPPRSLLDNIKRDI